MPNVRSNRNRARHRQVGWPGVFAWFWVWLTVICLAGPAPAWALDPARPLSQFLCQNWNRQNGLSAEQINAITQTRDGFIWLATQRGLIRFDGLEFQSANLNLPRLPSPAVGSITASDKGGLWYTLDEGGCGHFDGRKAAPFKGEEWSHVNHEHVICETGDGSLWVGAENGTVHWLPGHGFSEAPKLPAVNTIAVREGLHQRIWLGTVQQGLFYRQDNKVTAFVDDELTNHIIFDVAEDARGRVWVGTENGLRGYDADFKPLPLPPLTTEVRSLLVDRRDTLWLGTSGAGLLRLRDNQFSSLRKSNGLLNDFVVALFEDLEGSLWVGTRGGLSQISDVKFPLISSVEGILDGPCLAVAPSAVGGLWIANSSGLSYLGTNGSSNFGVEAGLGNLYTKRVFEARNGDVYRVNGYKAIEVLSGGKVVKTLPQEAWPVGFAEDAASVIVSVGGSIFRIQNGALVPLAYRTGQEPQFYWVNNLTVSRDGALWVAGVNGIYRIADGLVRSWTTAEGLSSPKVNFICEDQEGVIWAGLLSGIARIKDGRLSNFDHTHGLPDNNIYAIVPDDQGALWVDSNRGLFRVSRQAMAEVADQKQSRFPSESFDGLRASKAPERSEQEWSGCKTLDGRIWFPRSGGVLMIDPANLYTNQIAPPVTIESIRVNGVELKDRQVPRLKPGKNKLEFRFAAPSYVAPRKVRMRYRLEGWDPDWIDAEAGRSEEYNGLRPGSYRFVVQAANADGCWNRAGDSFQIRFPTPFYQTDWFIGICILSSASLVFGILRWQIRHWELRQRKLQLQNDELERRIKERTAALEGTNVALSAEVRERQATEARLQTEIAEREKVDQALAQQRKLLRTLLDNLPDNVFVKDRDSRILVCNNAYARFLGASSEADIVGKRDGDLVPPDEARKMLQDDRQVLESGQTIHREESTVNLSTGARRWSQTTKVPIRDEQGLIIGMGGIQRDITERKEWEEKQEGLRLQLMEASREAGMAEVATGVLHNVGNVLNSVNVSSTMLSERIKNSKLPALSRALAMLQEHQHDLEKFTTYDPKGSRLMPFLQGLGQHLRDEQSLLMQELESLRMNVDHIKEIVAMQQSNARLSGVVETVSLDSIVDDALKIHSAAYQRHAVEVHRQYEASPIVLVDRHKLLQVLLNLLQNAKQACEEGSSEQREVTVRISCSDLKRVQVRVIDTGVGILPENLARVFEHGFTTRRDGHGFGLHSGALAAREMGGSLSAQSEGPGKGATFILELPLPDSSGTPVTPASPGPDSSPVHA